MSESMSPLIALASEARRQIGEGRLQRGVALLTALGSLTNGFESYVDHRRGAYRNRWLWTPVIVTLLAAAVAFAAVFSRCVARTLLPVVSAITLLDDLIGFVLHVRGIRRMPGGLMNLAFSVTAGPPFLPRCSSWWRASSASSCPMSATMSRWPRTRTATACR